MRFFLSPPAPPASLDTHFAPPPLAAVDIAFPPRQRCDFVLHYMGQSFHVHQLVLHVHSGYFKALFDTLPPPHTAPCDHSPDCHHPTIAHCVHIPTQWQPITGTVLQADTLRLFLCHLYFPSHYRCPPYLPHDDIDLDNELLPGLLPYDFPEPRRDELRPYNPLGPPEGGQLRSPPNPTVPGSVVFKEGLLTLAHYFDCPRLLQRCEDIATRFYLRGGVSGAAAMNDLRFAHHYRLENWKRRCLQLIAASRHMTRGVGMFEDIRDIAANSAQL